MSRRAVQRYKSGKHLLKRLTNNPALPQYIPTLAPETLNRVIQEIGVEDSAELIELSTPEQLSTILDDAIWQSNVPGVPESFHGQEFLRWAQAMLDIGEAFCAERLEILGDDVLATAFSHFLIVGGAALDTPSTAAATEAYGSYVVWPKAEDDWDVIYAMLNALHENEPELLQVLLLRCCLAPGHSRDANTAEMDATFEHEIGREARGFVTPESARVFLRSTLNSPLTTLCSEMEYDLATSRYFRLVERARAQTSETATADTEQIEANAVAGSTLNSSAEDMADLDQAIGQLELLDHDQAHPLLLAGPQASAEATTLQQALTALSHTDKPTLTQRLAEGAYLSNILMSGTTLDGKHFSEPEAAAAVAATCNLGLDYLDETDAGLANKAGLVRLFRVGWHIVQSLPLDVARKLGKLTQSVDAEASLRGWMLVEISELLNKEEFLADIREGSFGDIRETMDMLQLLLSSSHASELSALINDTPRIRNNHSADADSISPDLRFIETLDDLDQIDKLISAAEHDLRVL